MQKFTENEAALWSGVIERQPERQPERQRARPPCATQTTSFLPLLSGSVLLGDGCFTVAKMSRLKSVNHSCAYFVPTLHPVCAVHSSALSCQYQSIHVKR